MSQDQFDKYFYYQDGVLYSKRRKSWSSIEKKPYAKVRVNGKTYGIHVVIFALHHGFVPETVDHINGNPADNRIENLRAATNQQNLWNQQRNSSTGVKNVSFHKQTNKWQVRIRTLTKRLFLGLFEDLELAELVAIEARNKYHGEFANHGCRNAATI